MLISVKTVNRIIWSLILHTQLANIIFSIDNQITDITSSEEINNFAEKLSKAYKKELIFLGQIITTVESHIHRMGDVPAGIPYDPMKPVSYICSKIPIIKGYDTIKSYRDKRFFEPFWLENNFFVSKDYPAIQPIDLEKNTDIQQKFKKKKEEDLIKLNSIIGLFNNEITKFNDSIETNIRQLCEEHKNKLIRIKKLNDSFNPSK